MSIKLTTGSLLKIDFINLGFHGTSPSVILSINNRKFVINCPEGFQRIVNEKKLKISKIDHIFFLGDKWEHFGGFIGLSMTIRDIGKQKISFTSSMILRNMISAASPFLNTENLDYSMKSYNFLKESIDEYSYESSTITFNGAKFFLLDIILPPIKGKFLPEIARSKKIPVKLYTSLQQGKTVKNTDGLTIHPSEVLDADRKSPKITILDKFNFKETLNIPTKIRSDSDLVIHLNDYDTMINYQNDILSIFPEKCIHLWLENYEHSSFNPSFNGHSNLNRIFQNISPMFFHDINKHLTPQNISKHLNDKITSVATFNSFSCKVDDLFNNKLNIMPIESFESFKNRVLNEYKDEIIESPIKKLKMLFPVEDLPSIITLGTGSAMPSKYRNVSCTMVILSEKSCFLLDCGEGSLSQIISQFGYQTTDQLLTNLEFIFISHLHADHHLGLIRIIDYIKTRNLIRRSPLKILAPKLLFGFLDSYFGTADSPRIELINNNRLNVNKSISPKKKIIFESYKLITIPVEHAYPSYALIVYKKNETDPFVTYSGDCRPSESLANHGKNSEFFIHEATFDDSLMDEAVMKKHSTIKESLNISQISKSKIIILTHFSQRYPKIANFSESVSINSDASHIVLASDNMIINSKNAQFYMKIHPKLSDIVEAVEKTKKQKK